MFYSNEMWKEKIERYTKETAQFIDKWIDHFDEKGTALKDKWIEQSQTIDKQNRMLESLQKKEQLNQQTIQSLQKKLIEKESSVNHSQTEKLSKALAEKNEVVGRLLKHVQAQQKNLDEKDSNVRTLEETLKKSEKVILETEYRLTKSKELMKELQSERIRIQRENERASKLLQTYKRKLEEATSESTVRHYEHLIHTLTSQLLEVTEKTESIDREIKEENEKNINNEMLLEKEKKRTNEYLLELETIRVEYEKVISERKQLYGLIHNYKDKIDTYIIQLEQHRKEQEMQREEIQELHVWLQEECDMKDKLEIDLNNLNIQMSNLFSERETTSNELKKQMDLEQRMDRGFDKVFQYVKLSKTFYKDYRELKDPSERMSLEVGLIEMEIAYRMGKPKYRRNVVKTKEHNYFECEWGLNIGLPGRIYVRNEGAGCIVERISRVKDGGNRLSQVRVIEWLINQEKL